MASLDLLSTFLEIYRAGSVTAAARRLGLTQPAVTGQLARLEAELGTPLFTRSRAGVTPTPRAAALAARVGGHVDALREAARSDDADALTGTVRLGGAAELMTLRVLPALVPLTARGVRLDVTLGLAQDLLAGLAAGRLDVVVSAVRPAVPGVVAVPLVDEEFVLVAAPALARTVDADRLRDDPAAALAHLPLVAYAEELPIVRRYWRSELGRRPANPVAVTVPDLRAVLAAVVAGAGASVLPAYIAAPAIAAGTVEVLRTPEAPPLNTLYLATRRGVPPTPAVTAVSRAVGAAAEAWGTL